MLSISARKQRRSRPIQFSLRALLLLVTLISAGFAWLHLQIETQKRQHASAVQFEAWGAQIGWNARAEEAKENCPRWLRAALGDVFFEEVGLIDLRHSAVSDEQLKLVRDFPHAQVLLLGPEITDVGLAHMHSLQELDFISLGKAKVSPARTEALRRALPDCEIH